MGKSECEKFLSHLDISGCVCLSFSPVHLTLWLKRKHSAQACWTLSYTAYSKTHFTSGYLLYFCNLFKLEMVFKHCSLNIDTGAPLPLLHIISCLLYYCTYQRIGSHLYLFHEFEGHIAIVKKK